MKDAWKEYAADFRAMTDEEIEDECEIERRKLDEAESWLEAVASWEAAGKPRGDEE
jgi:hypothetical protein